MTGTYALPLNCYKYCRARHADTAERPPKKKKTWLSELCIVIGFGKSRRLDCFEMSAYGYTKGQDRQNRYRWLLACR